MNKLKVFESFAGYGSQSISLRDMNINHEVIGISEIEPDAIIAYGSIRFNLDELHTDKTHDEMKKELMAKNVGWDFQKQKSKIPRMKKDKLEMLYKFDKASNNFGDISIIDPNDLPNFDYFTYSFPCQSISISGKQEGIVKGKTRSGLLYECEKIIEAKKPKYLLMENVKALVSKKFIGDFEEWLSYLESLGYKNYWKVLNAKNYGIAQNRERVFCVSILGEDTYEFPNGFKLEKRLKDFLEDSIEDKYYLSDEIQNRFKQTKVDDGENNVIGTTAPEFRTIGQRDLVYGNESCANGTLVATDYKQPKQIIDYADRLGGCFDNEKGKHQAGSIWNKNGLSPTLDTMQGGYRQPLVTEEIKINKMVSENIKPGCRKQFIEDYNDIITSDKDIYNCNAKTDFSDKKVGINITPCIRANNHNTHILNDFRIRKLTPKECLRLMGLSDEDIDKIKSTGLSDSSLYKLAGNSIVKQCLDYIHINMFKDNVYKNQTPSEE